MVGWCHWLNGHEFAQTLGDSKGQGWLACCNSWGSKSGAHLGNNKKRATQNASRPIKKPQVLFGLILQ